MLIPIGYRKCVSLSSVKLLVSTSFTDGVTSGITMPHYHNPVTDLQAINQNIRFRTDGLVGQVLGTSSGAGGKVRINSPAHGLTTGLTLTLVDVGGTTEANVTATITVIDANNFDITGTTYVNAWTSGGWWFDNATNPTASVGMQLAAGDWYRTECPPWRIRLIEEAAGATVNANFFKQY